VSKGSEKGESVGAKDTASVADYYSAVTGGGASLSEGKASGGKSATGGSPSASTASSAGRGGPSAVDVGKGSVATGAKGMGGEGPSGMPAIGAPSVGRSATMGGPSIGTTPTVMGSDRAPSRAGFGAFMSSPRAAEDASMRSMRSGLMPTTARAAETMSMNRHTAIQNALTTIRAHEAGKVDPYNRLVDPERGYRTPSHADLTKMTIAEVMEYQKGMTAAGHKSSAVGAYQIIAPTLVSASRLAGVDPQTTKFSPAVQDRLAIALMDERARQATRDGSIDVTAFADRLADEWAAFKNSGGGGAYDGDGRNRASVDFSTVHDLAGDLIGSGAIQPSSRGSAATTPSVSLPNPGPIPASAPADRPGGLMPGNVSWEQDRRGLAVLSPPTGSPWDNLTPAAQQALSMLSTQRDQVALTAGARSREENAAAKGSKDSEHLKGNAFDISLRGMTDAEKAMVVEQASMAGATRLGSYSGHEVLHVDFAPSDKYAPTHGSVYAMHDMSNRNMGQAPGWFTAGLSQVTSPQPSARPDSAAPASGGFGRFMGDAAATPFGPSPRSLEGPGGVYLDAPPAQQPNMTTPPMGFSGGHTPRGQDDAPASGATPFGPSPRSMEGPGGIMLDYVPETSRPSRPEQFEAQPERNGKPGGGKADIDPGQERRDRRADRIDEALPWVAGPIAGAINDARSKAGKSTFGDWLSGILDGTGGGAALPIEAQGGEGVSAVAPIVSAPKAPDTGSSASRWLIDILEEPRPTPREKWGRGLMPT
jgi:muramidase (phage lysozyme)